MHNLWQNRNPQQSVTTKLKSRTLEVPAAGQVVSSISSNSSFSSVHWVRSCPKDNIHVLLFRSCVIITFKLYRKVLKLLLMDSWLTLESPSTLLWDPFPSLQFGTWSYTTYWSMLLERHKVCRYLRPVASAGVIQMFVPQYCMKSWTSLKLVNIAFIWVI